MDVASSVPAHNAGDEPGAEPHQRRSTADPDWQRYVGRFVTLAGHPARIRPGPKGCGCIEPVDRAAPCVPLPWSVIIRVCDEHAGRFM